MQNVEQLLATKRLETFTVSGNAPNVLMADQMSWQALENILGGDPVEAWALKAMQHTYAGVGDESDPKPATSFQAEFVRNPDYEADA